MTWYKIQLWLTPFATLPIAYLLWFIVNIPGPLDSDSSFNIFLVILFLLLLAIITTIVSPILYFWKPATAHLFHLVGTSALILPYIYLVTWLDKIDLVHWSFVSLLIVIGPIIFFVISWKEWHSNRLLP